MGEDENYYEDPAFYEGINTGIFSMIDGIWDLVDRGNNTPQQTQQQQQQTNLTPLFWGLGILGILVLFVLVAVILKKS